MLKIINCENMDELLPQIEQKLNERFPAYHPQTFYYTTHPVCDNFEYVYSDFDDKTIRREIKYAVVDQNADDELIGYFTYYIDLYRNCAENFVAASFRPSMIIINDVIGEMERLIEHFDCIRWTVVSGNKTEKYYTDFCKKHGGTIMVQHNGSKDLNGKYHNELFYEIKRRHENDTV